MGCLNWILAVLVAVLAAEKCRGYTDPRDVFAVNSLYSALGFPALPGWLPVGGDPCAESWQGIQCVNANITGIVLNGANLGGELGNSLGFFASVIQIDLSDNHIRGAIPSNLPVTVRSFFLSGNQLTGNIPNTLSSLGQLSDLAFNDNHLTGVIPDAFQPLVGLTNLDLSGNNLNGQLPPSLGNLSSLNALHLQNNQLSGMLDVLQDLPLIDLDIENNLFSGPIPSKLLNIPNFRRAGNPFNTTIIPSPSPPPSHPSSPPPYGALPPALIPTRRANGPSSPNLPQSSTGVKKSTTSKYITWLSIAGFLIFIILALGLCLLTSQCCKRRKRAHKFYNVPQKSPKNNESLIKIYDHNLKDNTPNPNSNANPNPNPNPNPKPNLVGNVNGRSKLALNQELKSEDLNRRAAILRQKEEHEIDMSGEDIDVLPPPPPPPFLNFEDGSDIVNHFVGASSNSRVHNGLRFDGVREFTVGSLQQYTNSFSQENLIGGGMLGTVYRAELPDGKLMAIKKLKAAISTSQSREDFLELVSNISKLRHPNIVKLVGYCSEHGQRLLAYEYCGNGTLHEALHVDDEIHKELSWKARIHLAVQAAKALEYLHEVCQPPTVHRNFKSSNVHLGDGFVVKVADCGLAPLISSNANSLTELQGNGYGAPELELGSYTYQSDVYSFGVLMLELLTGRKSFDRTRPRAEQFLVRWAIPRLHDIDMLLRMVDPSLKGAYVSKSLSRFADIISLCLQLEPEFRPPMSEIVQDLVKMIERDL